MCDKDLQAKSKERQPMTQLEEIFAIINGQRTSFCNKEPLLNNQKEPDYHKWGKEMNHLQFTEKEMQIRNIQKMLNLTLAGVA